VGDEYLLGAHTYCSDHEEEENELIASLGSGSEAAVRELILRNAPAISERLVINFRRSAVQILTCDERGVIAHLPLDHSVLAGLITLLPPGAGLNGRILTQN
jgi:hypothetical protein